MKDPRTTEMDSKYSELEKMPLKELLTNINREDQTVPLAVEACLPEIEALVAAILPRMKMGGRLFYMGAGTSGRLGIVDASECPPTFGVDHNTVIGIIAGGDSAIRKAVEFAEDDTLQGWKDLQSHQVNETDSVIGITASGTAPYVIGAIETCKQHGILTGSITCNKNSKLGRLSDFPIECEVGPEFITGSTRMKSGTAQKLILNMISSSLMIQLGRVKGNKMVDMQLSNDKLVDRGTRMVMEATGLSYDEAKSALLNHGSVRAAVEALMG
ncbi:MAG: N-acetylmuramic acid 6-phosphate etherase [Bacteroidetes bacterium]|nr:N-acetylmuramic acid 6-phosphate etherase [Bacteroidota bacterium]